MERRTDLTPLRAVHCSACTSVFMPSQLPYNYIHVEHFALSVQMSAMETVNVW